MVGSCKISWFQPEYLADQFVLLPVSQSCHQPESDDKSYHHDLQAALRLHHINIIDYD